MRGPIKTGTLMGEHILPHTVWLYTTWFKIKPEFTHSVSLVKRLTFKKMETCFSQYGDILYE